MFGTETPKFAQLYIYMNECHVITHYYFYSVWILFISIYDHTKLRKHDRNYSY